MSLNSVFTELEMDQNSQGDLIKKTSPNFTTIRKDIEELEEEEKAQTAAYGSLAMKVSYLDVGDNCYSVEMTGKGIDKVATPFPFSLNNKSAFQSPIISNKIALKTETQLIP